jgi:hypothetical protein
MWNSSHWIILPKFHTSDEIVDIVLTAPPFRKCCLGLWIIIVSIKWTKFWPNHGKMSNSSGFSILNSEKQAQIVYFRIPIIPSERYSNAIFTWKRIRNCQISAQNNIKECYNFHIGKIPSIETIWLFGWTTLYKQRYRSDIKLLVGSWREQLCFLTIPFLPRKQT